MEAMVLAAGAGTRLRPITDRIPKALVKVRGRPMLAHVLDRLVESGCSHVIVNTHHHEAQINTFIDNSAPIGLEIDLSPEPYGPYDTGGGLFAAARFFKDNRPFLLHNVDVLSDIPLDELLITHQTEQVRSEKTLVASLAVDTDDSNRQLLFDNLGLLGWENTGSDRATVGAVRVREPVGSVNKRSFIGIHVIDPRIFSLSDRTGTFSIITLYLELAALGHRILPIDVSANNWIDVGTPERLDEANNGVW